MEKLVFSLIVSLIPLLTNAADKSGTRAGESNQTQDFVTDTLPNGFYYLDYFNCDMFVDKLAFKIISPEERTVELTNLRAAEMYGDRWIYRMDTMRIPKTIIWQDIVYTVKAIGPWAFCYSEIKHLEIPPTVTEIKEHAFSFIEELEELVIPNSVTKIGDYAFGGNVLHDRTLFPKKIVFPDSVTSWGENLFYSRRGDYIPLPDYVTKIPPLAYYDCGLEESPRLSENVDTISFAAFGDNPFETIELPENLKVIEKSAFSYCGNLKSVTIPASVVSIAEKSFYTDAMPVCSLDTLRLLSTTPPECGINWEGVNWKGEYEINTNTVIVVPDGTKGLYQVAWKLSLTPVYEESENTAINEIRSNDSTKTVYYSLDGRRLKSPQKGINIIRQSDGTTKKVIVK